MSDNQEQQDHKSTPPTIIPPSADIITITADRVIDRLPSQPTSTSEPTTPDSGKSE